MLIYPVVVIKSSLGTPAYMHSAVRVRFGPLHNFGKLFPILDLLKWHMLNGRTRDYETVVKIFTNVIKGFVKGEKMLLGNVFCLMALGVDKLKLHLKRGVTEKARELSFGFYLFRHKIKKKYLQRSYILSDSTPFGHHENIFISKRFYRRQIVWNFNRHILPTLNILECVVYIRDKVTVALYTAGKTYKI